MAENITHHVTKYKTHAFVLLALLILTALSVLASLIDFDSITMIIAISLAATKAVIVLWYFMHLKYESRMIRLMVYLVLLVFIAILIVTFLDYNFR